MILYGYVIMSNHIHLIIQSLVSAYIYSSASTYVDNSGLLTIEKADNPVVNVLNSKSFTTYNLY